MNESPLRKGKIAGTPGWLAYSNADCAILIRNVHITNPQIGIHTFAAEINRTRLVSVYASPNKDLQPVIDEIETLANGWNY